MTSWDQLLLGFVQDMRELRLEHPYPAEVNAWVGYFWAHQPRRVVAFPKNKISKEGAWAECQAYGRKLGVRTAYAYQGWRKHHTRHYWVWVAVDLKAFDALACLTDEPPELSLREEMEWRAAQRKIAEEGGPGAR